MRINANQVSALFQLMKDGAWFHFDISGSDPLDRRIVNVNLWSFEYEANRFVAINENGTVFDRKDMTQFVLKEDKNA